VNAYCAVCGEYHEVRSAPCLPSYPSQILPHISRTMSEDEVRRIARDEIQKFLAGKILTNGEAL